MEFHSGFLSRNTIEISLEILKNIPPDVSPVFTDPFLQLNQILQKFLNRLQRMFQKFHQRLLQLLFFLSNSLKDSCRKFSSCSFISFAWNSLRSFLIFFIQCFFFQELLQKSPPDLFFFAFLLEYRKKFFLDLLQSIFHITRHFFRNICQCDSFKNFLTDLFQISTEFPLEIPPVIIWGKCFRNFCPLIPSYIFREIF